MVQVCCPEPAPELHVGNLSYKLEVLGMGTTRTNFRDFLHLKACPGPSVVPTHLWDQVLLQILWNFGFSTSQSGSHFELVHQLLAEQPIAVAAWATPTLALARNG